MNKKICLLILLLTFFFSNSVFALGGYVGGGLGYANLDFDTGGSTGLLINEGGSVSGATRVGMVFGSHFSLGLNLSWWIKTERVFGFDVTSTVYPIAIEGNWHIISDNNGPYLGVSVASVVEAVTVSDPTDTSNDNTDTESESAIGAQAGWNFALAPRHSLGVEARYYKVNGSPYKYTFTSGLIMYSFWFGGRQ